jgi:chromosome segregation ATPase
MIEPIMYLAIGALVAMLLGLTIMPLVHSRAVRLTTKRLEAATPLSMVEIQADRDQLRAEFAVSAQRLETRLATARAQTASQLAELGRKADAVNRLKQDLGDRIATIATLEENNRLLAARLAATEDEFAERTEQIRTSEAALHEKAAELSRLTAECASQTSVADAGKAELAATHAEIETLRLRAESAEQQLATTRDQLAAQRRQGEATASELGAARDSAQQLGARIAELERELAAGREDRAALRSTINALEGELKAQGDLLEGHRHENRELRDQIKAEYAARRGAPAPGSNTGIASEAAEAELADRLHLVESERDGLKRDLEALRQHSEAAVAAGHGENALLRERINDIAAEVARLAITLEGPHSAIDAMLDADPGVGKPLNGTAPAGTAAAPGGASLAERIRALQSHAARMPSAG